MPVIPSRKPDVAVSSKVVASSVKTVVVPGKIASKTTTATAPKSVAAPGSEKIATKITATAVSPAKGGSIGKIGVGLAGKKVLAPAKNGSVAAAEAAAKALLEEAAAAASAAIIIASAAAAAELAAREAAEAEAEAAEVERLFKLHNGTCCVRFNHYKKILKITNGKLTAEAVDDELSLSFVFKNCKIHLAHSDTGSAAEKEPREPQFLKEEINALDQSTVFCDLISDTVYWACVEENSIEKAAFEKRQSEKIVPIYTGKSDDDDNNGIVKERQESCSCIEGNPCMSAYNCKDWANRFDLAKAHGWRGP